MVRPPEMEFSDDVIQEVLKKANYCCSICKAIPDKKRGIELSIHHRLPISVATTYFTDVTAELISSIDNAEVLCTTCHKKKHPKRKFNKSLISEFRMNQYREIAGELKQKRYNQ